MNVSDMMYSVLVELLHEAKKHRDIPKGVLQNSDDIIDLYQMRRWPMLHEESSRSPSSAYPLFDPSAHTVIATLSTGKTASTWLSLSVERQIVPYAFRQHMTFEGVVNINEGILSLRRYIPPKAVTIEPIYHDPDTPTKS